MNHHPPSTLVTAVTGTLWGVDARPVEITVRREDGDPQFLILGLQPAAIRESRERVRAALRASGYDLPNQAITVQLAPAPPFSNAAVFDLPIALALLASCGHLPQEALNRRLIVGELSLDGSIRPVRGGLALAALGRQLRFREVLLPAANAPEAATLEALPVVGLRTLTQTVLHVTGIEPGATAPTVPSVAEDPQHDLADVRGQEAAKRALEIAAAGGHNLLFIGPPGSGKTMLARRLPGLLPPLTRAEAISVTQLYSLVAEEPPAGLLLQRPFRSPHTGTSIAGMIGGGSHPRPGEASLAHNGVLFLDELPEFRRNSLEALCRALDEGVATVYRPSHRVDFPARFLLVAAMDPCACGHLGDPRYACRCSPALVDRYRQRIAGRFLDRFDLHVEVPGLETTAMRSPSGETSRTVALRVAAAREIQLNRFGAATPTLTNAAMELPHLARFCALDIAARSLLDATFARLGLSAASSDQSLRVARTIADLSGSATIRASHLAEALQYRRLR